MSSVALKIENLCYAFRHDWTFKRIERLHNVTLDVQAGEAFGFLGPNGAGKTTTIKCILDLIRPSSGSIQIFDQNSRRSAARKTVGYLPEQPYFYDHLSVRELVEMYALLADVPAHGRHKRVNQVLEQLEIGERANTRMRALSKGLTQRVAMAQAIVANPSLLILDEPFSGLDPLGRRTFRELIMQLRANGTTIFMSSHVLGDVEFICDRVSILQSGNLRAILDIRELTDQAGGSFELTIRDYRAYQAELLQLELPTEIGGDFIRLKIDQRSKAEELLRHVIDRGMIVESFEYRRPSLEDLFVEIVSCAK